MRDPKEALRHRVDYLEDELAEKEAEIARLRAEAERPPRGKKKRRKAAEAARGQDEKEPEPESLDPPELAFGQPLPDGSVRYVVRPVEPLWVGIMAAAAAGMLAVIGGSAVSDGKDFPWLMLPIFALLPLTPTFRAGFDVNVARKTIEVWQSWGPITTSHFTIQRLRLPEVRTAMETSTNSDGVESRGRVTRLYWTNQNIRSTLARSKLDELMSEVRALVASAGKADGGSK